MSIRQAEGKFDGEKIVLFSKELDGNSGRRSLTVSTLEDGGKRIVHRQFSIGKDDSEGLVMELVLTRK